MAKFWRKDVSSLAVYWFRVYFFTNVLYGGTNDSK